MPKRKDRDFSSRSFSNGSSYLSEKRFFRFWFQVMESRIAAMPVSASHPSGTWLSVGTDIFFVVVKVA